MKTVDSWVFSFKTRVELAHLSAVVDVTWEKRIRRERKMDRSHFAWEPSLSITHLMTSMKMWKIQIFSDLSLKRGFHYVLNFAIAITFS